MSVDKSHIDSVYGLSQALQEVAPRAIVSRRNPTARDKAAIGQIWVNRTAATSYVLVDVANNAAVWGLANTPIVGNYAVGGTVTAGTGLVATTGGLTVTAGGATITAGGLTVNAGGAAITGNSTVTGSFTTTTSITAGTTLAAGTTVTSGTTVTAGTGLTVTAGNATLTNGNLVFTAAATYISLPGPVFIRSGAGAPANGLALHIGDMYIRTDAGAAAERIYVATGVGAWTNVTCAA